MKGKKYVIRDGDHGRKVNVWRLRTPEDEPKYKPRRSL